MPIASVATEALSSAARPIHALDRAAETQQLLQQLELANTLPLWEQMTKLNPPAPNPTCIPHLWKYDEIQPHLIKAGELVTEDQAERRVLMLINPQRRTSHSLAIPMENSLTLFVGLQKHHTLQTLCMRDSSS